MGPKRKLTDEERRREYEFFFNADESSYQSYYYGPERIHAYCESSESDDDNPDCKPSSCDNRTSRIIDNYRKLGCETSIFCCFTFLIQCVIQLKL